MSAKLSPVSNHRIVPSDGMQEVRPEKKPDVTVIYHMRAAGAPWAKAVFSAPLNLDLAPGEEWHWAIVQARGYPPQIPGNASQAPPTNGELPAQSGTTVPSAITPAAPVENPQPVVADPK
jgi:hypothetical protein